MKKKVNLLELLNKKEYSKIISVLEDISLKQNLNPSLINLLGTCRLMKMKPKREDYILAIKDFRNAYIKSDNDKFSIESLRNFINASISLIDHEKSKIDNYIHFKNLDEAINFFFEKKNIFIKEISIISPILRVFRKKGDIKGEISLIKDLFKNQKYYPTVISNFIFLNNFIYDWDQKNFLKHGKLLDKFLPIYDKNSLEILKKKINKKIKIGFLSSDLLRNHSVTYFFKSIIENYNKNKFEIYLYLNHKSEASDETTKYFKNNSEDVFNISNLDDISAINLIRSKKIDILIDLMGVTSSPRLELIKNRVAPIQVSWCGYCNTTGIKEMDYIISDPNLIYKLEESYYCERVIFMPKIWNCHSGFDLKRVFSEAPSIKNDYITFGSFNNFNKISDEVINTWSNILKSVKNSKLLLKSSTPVEIKVLSEKFKSKNVLHSIEFISHEPNFENHLKDYQKIDIALDTFPYNGVTTSFEAIWMNVPVLTMKGYNFNSRCGESIIKNLGINFLIAQNENDYIFKARELGENKTKLFNLRKKIFDEAIKSPLFDKKSFSNNFFNLLEKTINNHQY